MPELEEIKTSYDKLKLHPFVTLEDVNNVYYEFQDEEEKQAIFTAISKVEKNIEKFYANPKIESLEEIKKNNLNEEEFKEAQELFRKILGIVNVNKKDISITQKSSDLGNYIVIGNSEQKDYNDLDVYEGNCFGAIIKFIYNKVYQEGEIKPEQEILPLLNIIEIDYSNKYREYKYIKIDLGTELLFSSQKCDARFIKYLLALIKDNKNIFEKYWLEVNEIFESAYAIYQTNSKEFRYITSDCPNYMLIGLKELIKNNEFAGNESKENLEKYKKLSKLEYNFQKIFYICNNYQTEKLSDAIAQLDKEIGKDEYSKNKAKLLSDIIKIYPDAIENKCDELKKIITIFIQNDNYKKYAFFEAIKYTDFEFVKSLFDLSNPCLSIKDHNGLTAFDHALANLDFKINRNANLFNEALYSDELKILELLINNNSLVINKNNQGTTAIDRCKNNQLKAKLVKFVDSKKKKDASTKYYTKLLVDNFETSYEPNIVLPLPKELQVMIVDNISDEDVSFRASRAQNKINAVRKRENIRTGKVVQLYAEKGEVLKPTAAIVMNKNVLEKLVEAKIIEPKIVKVGKDKTTIYNIANIFTTAVITTFRSVIQITVTSSKSWKGFTSLCQSIIKPTINKIDNIFVDKLVSRIPVEAKTFIRSSAPIITALAAVKASWSLFKNIRDGKNITICTKDAAYEFGKTIAEGGVASLGAAAGTITAGAICSSAAIGVAASIGGAAASIYVASKTVEIVGPFTKKIANNVNAKLGLAIF